MRRPPRQPGNARWPSRDELARRILTGFSLPSTWVDTPWPCGKVRHGCDGQSEPLQNIESPERKKAKSPTACRFVVGSAILGSRGSSMRCPFCQLDHDRVIDSRASDDGFAIRRRRECLKCRRRYTTYERLEEHEVKVVK